jgi:hypothetical protein
VKPLPFPRPTTVDVVDVVRYGDVVGRNCGDDEIIVFLLMW